MSETLEIILVVGLLLLFWVGLGMLGSHYRRSGPVLSGNVTPAKKIISLIFGLAFAVGFIANLSYTGSDILSIGALISAVALLSYSFGWARLLDWWQGSSSTAEPKAKGLNTIAERGGANGVPTSAMPGRVVGRIVLVLIIGAGYLYGLTTELALHLLYGSALFFLFYLVFIRLKLYLIFVAVGRLVKRLFGF